MLVPLLVTTTTLFLYWLTCDHDESYGVVYIKNFFSDEEYQTIKKECKILKQLTTDEKGSIAVGRQGCFVPLESVVTQLCRSKEKCYKLGFSDDVMPADMPVEYREYPIGSFMDWHKDTQLYKIPQYEIVYTIDNTSDAKFQWYDYRLQKRREIQTEPNSAVVIRANDVEHRVVGSTKGSRSILKFVFTKTFEKTPFFYDTTQSY
ncbi:hypothetical protein [Dishui Lake phycodnavirus 4]|nr:hypothetical protein [Dishui Lake phycodnavirus 4]